MRANTYFDLITGTGIATLDHTIPRRYYRDLSSSKTKKNRYQKVFRYSSEAEPTGSVIKALEEMHPAERSDVQQDRERRLFVDTPPISLPKQQKPKAVKQESSRENVNPAPQVSQVLDTDKKRTFGEMQTPAPTPPEDPVFLEAELRALINNTDLLECFANWVQKLGS